MINLTLSLQEIQVLVSILCDTPYVKSASLISKLDVQATPQIKAIHASAVAEAEAKAKECEGCEEGCEDCDK